MDAIEEHTMIEFELEKAYLFDGIAKERILC